MQKYLFIHIPKTAGVKIRHNIHMNSNYPHAKICVQEEGFDLRFMTDAELQDYDIISGHFGYGLRRRHQIYARWPRLLTARSMSRIRATIGFRNSTQTASCF